MKSRKGRAFTIFCVVFALVFVSCNILAFAEVPHVHEISPIICGCNSYKCTGCDCYFYDGQWHDAPKAHNSLGRYVVSEATCEDDETYYTYCDRHGTDTSYNQSEVTFEPNTALGHDFSSGIYQIVDEESHRIKCIRCDEYGIGDLANDIETHDFNQGDGIDEHRCVCGYIDPKSPHHGFDAYGKKCQDPRCSAVLGDGPDSVDDVYEELYKLPTEYDYRVLDSEVDWLRPKPVGQCILTFNYLPYSSCDSDEGDYMPLYFLVGTFEPHDSEYHSDMGDDDKNDEEVIENCTINAQKWLDLYNEEHEKDEPDMKLVDYYAEQAWYYEAQALAHTAAMKDGFDSDTDRPLAAWNHFPAEIDWDDEDILDFTIEGRTAVFDYDLLPDGFGYIDCIVFGDVCNSFGGRRLYCSQ
ncbi:MAG: hypothetical protein IKR04_06345 [Clostridia bacterium]|nr:hypothetical protein [Clostridia bacterium]